MKAHFRLRIRPGVQDGPLWPLFELPFSGTRCCPLVFLYDKRTATYFVIFLSFGVLLGLGRIITQTLGKKERKSHQSLLIQIPQSVDSTAPATFLVGHQQTFIIYLARKGTGQGILGNVHRMAEMIHLVVINIQLKLAWNLKAYTSNQR